MAFKDDRRGELDECPHRGDVAIPARTPHAILDVAEVARREHVQVLRIVRNLLILRTEQPNDLV